ncbi:helix-turn-helix domain-containing protein [Ammonifex thiophilus]|uniref:DNA-binding protein n=1 Tax=Ammonifex thiophilus TaxID=444093 RepID=A0A3D8P1C7_9THEO|nr:helix-turn-helix domain-containing protein [Ammonifex thiophilus]RDV81248.1 DNA-binding protein [Ammonifex thiophilus]
MEVVRAQAVGGRAGDAESLPSMLTVKEVARLLRMPTKTVFEHCRTGKIPCVKIGRTVRVPKKKLLEVLNLREEDLSS